MDDIDRAQDQEQVHRDAALSVRKAVPKHAGRCLSCFEPSITPLCGMECQKAYEIDESARIRNGL